jgi:hypothetical protein
MMALLTVTMLERARGGDYRHATRNLGEGAMLAANTKSDNEARHQ